ncbi:helix-turn-helix domain-containing protein [Candidatus Poribacteria bacterium]
MPKRSSYVMSVKDTADVVGVSERTVYNWVYQGKIEAHELPAGGWRIPLHAVAELVGLTEQQLRASLSTPIRGAKNANRVDYVLRKGLDNVESLAQGGNFESKEDLARWELHVEDGSEAKLEIDETTSVTGKSSLFFNIIRLSGNDYSRPRISQDQEIKEGGIYTLSAFYKAEEERKAYIAVQLDKLPWTLFVEKGITIGTEWEEHWATFTAPRDGKVTIQPSRNANSDVKYWLDGVRFFEGEYRQYGLEQTE